MFVASCLLRIICRSLIARSLSWIALEVWAFAWSMLLGIAASFLTELTIPDLTAMDRADLILNSVQSAIILFLWCSLYLSIKQWQQSARGRERLLRAEAEVREARLSALRYQLNPHFLLNSLNAASTLVLEENGPAATRMLSQIGELLRTTLDGEPATEIALSQEVAFTEQYLAIEQTRLGDRLHVDIAVAPETLDALVPSMLLQPLVENAVRHGVAPMVAGGRIRIESRVQDARLQICVQNTGARNVQRNGRSVNGIGLNNTAERLKTLYAHDCKFELQWPESGGCEVVIELPLRKNVPEKELACVR
jgi:two-component system sensor histidine kinase AlgZ